MSEEHVFVTDIGSSSVKAGYSGEDIPSFVFPSTVTLSNIKNLESIENFNAETSATQYSTNMITHPVQRGAIKDWESLEKVWNNLTEIANLTNLDSTSILIVDSIKSTAVDRSHWAEMLFETNHVPSICIHSSAPLTIFASGRTTGVAVQCGAGITSSVPVFEGLALTHAVTSMEFGGQDITANLKKLFNDKGILIDHSSAKIIKEKLAYVQGYRSSNLEHTITDKYSFCLPDGNDVTVDTKMLSECSSKLFVNNSISSGGLVNQVHESITLCDESIKKDLTNNIIISGGASLLPGLGDKLNNDLTLKFENDPKNSSLGSLVRVVPNSNYREAGYTLQRQHASWIGGSLLGSFDTYHKTLKITRQEWDENAESILNIKSF